MIKSRLDWKKSSLTFGKKRRLDGKFQGRESRAEIVLVAGDVAEINYTSVAGRAPLAANEMRFFQEIVAAKANEIVVKWIDFFVLHKSIESERITRRLR